MTSGLRGSPAASASRGGVARRVRSAWMSMRHTVGGAQKVWTPQRTISSSRRSGEKRSWRTTSTVASAFQGPKTLL